MKHEVLVKNQLCEKLDQISQLIMCFQHEKKQSEELKTLAVILDPIIGRILFIFKCQKLFSICVILTNEGLNITSISYTTITKFLNQIYSEACKTAFTKHHLLHQMSVADLNFFSIFNLLCYPIN